MTASTCNDLIPRARSRSLGIMRTAFDRIVEGRDRKGRRHTLSGSLVGYDRLDLSEIERRSLFDLSAPERH